MGIVWRRTTEDGSWATKRRQQKCRPFAQKGTSCVKQKESKKGGTKKENGKNFDLYGLAFSCILHFPCFFIPMFSLRLAKFKQQLIEKFGDAQAFFQAIDSNKINKVRQQDFVEKCALAVSRDMLDGSPADIFWQPLNYDNHSGPYPTTDSP